MVCCLQGRLGKKADKASKRLWEYGLTSVFTFDDHVDNAEFAAQTRAGVIGVQVWIIYRDSAVQPNEFVQPAAEDVKDVPVNVLVNRSRSRRPLPSPSAWWSDLRPAPAHEG